MLNEIRMPHGKIEHLVRVFRRSRPFIRKALRGLNNDEMSLKIRYTAVREFGGYEIEKVNN